MARTARAIAYVGDRVDNDVQPAAEPGLVSVLLRRNPWGFTGAHWPAARSARLRVDDLASLADASSRCARREVIESRRT